MYLVGLRCRLINYSPTVDLFRISAENESDVSPTRINILIATAVSSTPVEQIHTIVYGRRRSTALALTSW
jgi:hypothetical protein